MTEVTYHHLEEQFNNELHSFDQLEHGVMCQMLDERDSQLRLNNDQLHELTTHIQTLEQELNVLVSKLEEKMASDRSQELETQYQKEIQSKQVLLEQLRSLQEIHRTSQDLLLEMRSELRKPTDPPPHPVPGHDSSLVNSMEYVMNRMRSSSDRS